MTSIWFNNAINMANKIQKEVDSLGFRISVEKINVLMLYDEMVTDNELREISRKLFYDGHYARAVEEAFKCINNLVKKKAKKENDPKLDGSDLMHLVFSPDKPVLKINSLKTKSDKCQQQGYMEIFAGCMTGIRNPRAHEHKHYDEMKVALEMLAWANHLIHIARNAKRTYKHSSESSDRNRALHQTTI